MTTNVATQRLIDDGESAKTQFIKAADSLDQIAQSVCALLNTAGGTIVVGLEDNDSTTGPIDAKQAEAIRQHLLKVVTPPVVFSVSLDEIEQGKVVVIDVPAGRDVPYVAGGSVYVQRGRSTKLADADMIRQMVLETSSESPRWERRPSLGLEVDGLATELLDETIRQAQDRRGYRFENSHREAVLENLGLLQFGRLTNAADVVFGEKVFLRHPQTRLRAVCYSSDRSENFLDEQLYEGPAFRLLDDVLAFLKRHIAIAAEFVPGQAERVTRPTFPFNSLEEGIVNALVHRDYASFSGSVSVSVYPDRVEIWNSGQLPKGLTAKMLEMAQHASILINPDISHVFYLRGLMERVGRGTYKMVRECRQFGMRTPQWKNVASGVRLTLFAATGDFSLDLNERQRTLLEHMEPGNQIVTTEFSQRFAPDISARQARRDLEELEDLGFLSRSGVGRGTTYTRTEERIE
jgi:ATP-dependent DNA helicase RecG